jgi:hypothetical protein
MATKYDTWLEGDCGVDESEEARAERIAKRAAKYAEDDAKRREAEEWIAGGFDGEFYTALTLALYDLHITEPADLLGMQTLTRLYELAKIVAGKMDAELERMAADDLDREDRNHD